MVFPPGMIRRWPEAFWSPPKWLVEVPFAFFFEKMNGLSCSLSTKVRVSDSSRTH